MEKYREVRHIICPLCDRGFAAFLDYLDYSVEGHNGRWEKMKCPKCETEIFVSDTERYTLLAEDTAFRRIGITIT